MNIESLRKYCLGKQGSEESFPFGENTLVFKVSGKMFLLVGLESLPLRFSVKCDPVIAEELREQYPAIEPAFHMNKKHWNMVSMDGSVPAALVKKMIDDSYELILESLPAKTRSGFKKNHR
jgi:predicted DNA-binding protein (MmcQ/YjbR family)